MKNEDYTKETLLSVLESYGRVIRREKEINNNEFAAVTLDDIEKSIKYILKVCEYEN